MANGFENWDDWMAPSGDPYGRPEALGTLEDYRTPGQDWARLMSQVQPFWTTRVPMKDIGERLRARYLLAGAGMAERPGVSPSFSQFLSDYPGRFAAGDAQTIAPYGAAMDRNAGAEIAELRLRAEEAARAAMTAPAAYMAGTADDPELFRRRAWFGQQFGADAGEAAAQNQMAVANLLALQRPEGGAYRGGMANAIRRAMANLYQQRLNVNAPQESFLNWYLAQTAPQASTQASEQ